MAQNYNLQYMTIEELEKMITPVLDSMDMTMVLSAYEMCENAHSGQFLPDGAPYFYHTTRVCRIIADELGLIDAELLSSALLHDIYKTNAGITLEIINYNFGPYVALLVDMLQSDYRHIDPNKVITISGEKIKIPGDDYLIIWIAEHLDNLRSYDIDPKYDLVSEINELKNVIIPAAIGNDNAYIKKLVSDLKKEAGKFLC
ncbi:MAG: HD domain-containing protein [Bacteroidota bacterium]